MNFFKNKIAYREEGDGLPFVIFHGFFLDHQAMWHAIEPVIHKNNLDKSFRRIYLDLPGMGESVAPTSVASFEEYFQIVLDFVLSRVGDSPFLVLGNSFGGYLADLLIKKISSKVLGAFFLCPVIEPDKKKRNLPISSSKSQSIAEKQFLSTLPEEERKDFLENGAIYTKEIYLRYVNEICCGVKKADANYLGKMSQHFYGLKEGIIRHEKPFIQKVFCLCGRQDIVVGYEDFFLKMDDYPNASFFVLNEAGHNLHLEQKDFFEYCLCHFLTQKLF